MLALTKTKTVTKTRLTVIEDQFEILMRYAGIPKERRSGLREAVEKKEIVAFGLYIEEGEFVVAEVSVEVDWALHGRLVKLDGEMFDAERGGWEDGESPEVSVYANRISKEARRLGKSLRSWVRFSSEVGSDPERHKELCEKLGYSFGSSAPAFPEGLKTHAREVKCADLPELVIKLREA